MLGYDLEFVEREAQVGDFSADIVARDTNRDRIVVIENQLQPTDHPHLGQLVTYAAGFEASAVVWISPEFRDEHRQALDWLNHHTDADTEFFGVVLELVQIEDSPVAVNFRLVAFPNTWSRQKKFRIEGSESLSERRLAYQAFFQALIDELRTKHQFTNAKVGQPENWFMFPAGISGMRTAAQ